MHERLLYIETVADEALDLSEDLVRLGLVRDLLDKLLCTNRDIIRELKGKVSDEERRLRYYQRHKYLNGKKIPVSKHLRERIRRDIEEEINGIK